MAHPGFWDSIVRDLTGRGMFGGAFQFRLILQPLAAVILGVRLGIKDAKRGDTPFFTALVHARAAAAPCWPRPRARHWCR